MKKMKVNPVSILFFAICFLGGYLIDRSVYIGLCTLFVAMVVSLILPETARRA